MASSIELNCSIQDGDLSSLEVTEKVKVVEALNPVLPTIMVVGRSKMGKSTALNNIWNLKLDTKISPKSVTKVVRITQVTKLDPRNMDGMAEVTLQVIDTPGMGALDITKESIKRDIQKVIKGFSFTLLYCFNVGPTGALSEDDRNIIRILMSAFGKEIWRKCVILFTFSDHMLQSLELPAEYISHIKEHAKDFEKLLWNVTGEKIGVKSIFCYESLTALQSNTNPSEIIAIPTKKSKENSKDILQHMIGDEEDWTDIVFIELMKRTNAEQREKFLLVKYHRLIVSSVATGSSLVGAGVGIGIGSLLGPIGMAVGGVFGALVTGAMATLSMEAVVQLVKYIKKKNA